MMPRTKKQSGRVTGTLSARKGQIVHFKKPGAAFDSRNQLFRGVTENDLMVEIEAKRVHSVMTKKLAPERLLLSAAMIGAGAVLLVVYVALAADDGKLPE